MIQICQLGGFFTCKVSRYRSLKFTPVARMRALVPWLPWFQVASIEVAPPFAEVAQWAAKQLPEALAQFDG